MRLKVGMEYAKRRVFSCITTEITMAGEVAVLGALADSVREVMDLGPELVEPALKIGTRLRTDFIPRMGKQVEQFDSILDVDELFSAGELVVVQGNRHSHLAV